ncbi:glycosyltransferase family 4 protein [Spirulina sp. 06S082]|uniref:glycosyltransferase family 4 protein n=1 Tax=Spirulina sp. 06S082 TaxID=3110248 RepID=UPI002B2146D9|nr:glycosyltransferase family 4 protein [Spirulina sp. 06S082]MEA5467367.1 glycosyltransferase family 4 protein [Spirulina sp. 06S082]
MRILLMIHIPLKPNLGASRVQLELAEEWQKEGHIIEKFDLEDAFPQQNPSLLATLTRAHFSQKAIAYIRENRHRFDIIDAHQGNLPISKTALGFSGLLVTRSVGLYPLYEQFNRTEIAQLPTTNLKTKIVHKLLKWRDRKELNYCFRTYETCDIINLLNSDEKQYLEQTKKLGKKCVVFPFGLSQSRQETLTQIVNTKTSHPLPPQIVFIGTWCPRKGSRDWQSIVQKVRNSIPKVRFLFLGTGVGSKKIIADLQLSREDNIEIIPSYHSDDLPELLKNATIGAFPSYIEGFGFAVLEKLAAGLPTVAYDVPGPREMLHDVEISLMVKAGDIDAFSNKLIELLQLSKGDRDRLSRECVKIAKRFSWRKIAKDTLNVYQESLQKLP